MRFFSNGNESILLCSAAGVSVQTDMTVSDIEALEKECVHLNESLYTARVKMERLEMTEEMLRKCQPKVIYYTGLPSFNTLQAVFKLLERYVPHGVNNLSLIHI